MEKISFDEGYFDTKPKEELYAKCKKCGNKAPAKDFKIDDDLGVMVCSNCFHSASIKKIGKKVESDKSVEEKEVVEEKPSSIVIYDEREALRSGEFKKREVVKPKVQDDRIKYICDKCGFGFKYNPIKMWPRVCPACGRSIEEIKRGSSISRL
jgi:hypothetical protein